MPVDLSTLPLGTSFAPLDGTTTPYIRLHPFDDQNPPRHVPPPTTASLGSAITTRLYNLAPLVALGHLHHAAHHSHPFLPTPPTAKQILIAAIAIHATPPFTLPACLHQWKTHALWRSTIDDYAVFLPSEITCLLHAIATHSGVALGLRLPFAWQTDTLWDVGCGYDYRPNTWGYFAAPAIAYTPAHVEIIAWGQVRTLTHDAVARYASEAYVPIGIHHHASPPTHCRVPPRPQKVRTVR